MSSSVQDFISAYTGAIRGKKDRHADTRRGSQIETLGGFTAVIWARESQHDVDLWNATHIATASDDDLTELIFKRYGVERILDTYGEGEVTLQRPNTSGGAGTIWRGTRIQVSTGSFSEAEYYEVATDTFVSATTTLVTVPIRASKIGSGHKIQAGPSDCVVYDPLWDNTWKVQSLNCSDGTDFESAAQLVARTREVRRNGRVGHEQAIIDACKAQGAQVVFLYESDFGGDAEDRGLNVCYVGYNGFTSDDTLVKKCKVALESVRVAGDNLQVLKIAPASLDISVDVYLKESPAVFNLEQMYRLTRDAILQVFSGGVTYSRDEIAANIYRAVPEVQEVVFVAPSSDASVLSVSGGLLNFPATLTRYSVRSVDVRFRPPR
jgi:hypothetical protein